MAAKKVTAPESFGLPKETKAKSSPVAKVVKGVETASVTVAKAADKVTMAAAGISPSAVPNVAPSPTLPSTGFDYNQFIAQYSQQFDFSGTNYKEDTTPTSGVDISKSILRSKGYPEELLDSTIKYYDALKQEGISEEEADTLYFNSLEYKTKDSRTLTSPFMSKYGKFIKASRETDLVQPLQGVEAIKYVEGIQNAVKNYGLNPTFASDESIVSYIKNNYDIKSFNDKLNEGKAATLTASEDYVQALKDQGFISSRADLINFYVDPTKGEEIFKQNKISGIIGAAALKGKRETPGMQQYNIATVQEAAKNYVAAGYTEKEATRLAESAYEQVQADLAPTLTASGIYETEDRTKNMGKTAEGQSLADLGRVGEIQSTLEKEQLLGNMASARRKKKLAEMYAAGLSGSSGTAGSISLSKNIQL